MTAVITTQQQQTMMKSGLKSAIKNAVKARNAKRRLHKRSLKPMLKQLRKTTKKVAATSTSTSIKKKPVKKTAGKKKPAKKAAANSEKRVYRMMEKIITKKGKKVRARVWRSEKLYKLKDSEKWLDIWAIDTRKPTKGSHIRVTSRPNVIVGDLLTTIVDIVAASEVVEAAQILTEA